MKEKKFLKSNEVSGTTFSLETIIGIAKNTIENMKDLYEFTNIEILYDPNFYITNEPVWYIEIIATAHKERFPDSSESLVISDLTGEPLCLINDHGVAHSIKYKL